MPAAEPDVYLTIGPDWLLRSGGSRGWSPCLRAVRAADNEPLYEDFEYWRDAVAFCVDLGLTWDAVNLV
jgi:hypothetical protein